MDQEIVSLLLRQAERYLSRGDVDGARTSFRRVLDLEPDNVEARAGLDSISDQRSVTATLRSIPSRCWGHKEWRVLAGLGCGWLLVLLFVFAIVRPGGEIRVSSPGAESTLTSTATVDRMTVTAEPTELSTMVVATTIEFTATATQTLQPSATPTHTSTPSATPTSEPSDTPAPTSTPQPPTNTPTLTGTPTLTPTLTPTPIPTMKYPAPRLLEPKLGQYFSGAQTRIELSWAPVGLLESDEWYGLILRYRHEGHYVETGAWLKESSYVVPSYLAGQADEPDRRYDWGVVVVRELGQLPDGTREGQELSLRSEMRYFVWR